jgi:hypothetical protein
VILAAPNKHKKNPLSCTAEHTTKSPELRKLFSDFEARTNNKATN